MISRGKAEKHAARTARCRRHCGRTSSAARRKPAAGRRSGQTRKPRQRQIWAAKSGLPAFAAIGAAIRNLGPDRTLGGLGGDDGPYSYCRRPPLNGTIPISGAKNATLPLMIASLLTDETLILDNVPRLADVGAA